jgi:uncharacterized protein
MPSGCCKPSIRNVITKITAGGESALQADVLKYRDGKLVKALTIGDTVMQEKVYGRK